jgi:serine/threonine-protein kinase PknG
MEYVGGHSLKDLLAARREANGGQADPLPAAQAIAYMVEILPALGYLHDNGLLFCDFKVDNVIQTQHSLKLIDLGGVYRVDEPSSAVFGTAGYQAPEIARRGPSVSSDLFTVARTLAVLCLDFRGYQTTHRYTLPGPDTVPLWRRHDALYRLLLKATAPDPDDRFDSASELADQLVGVLREVVAEEEGHPVPAASRLFTPPLRAGVEHPDWRVLPRPQVSADDPGAGYLATITATRPQQQIAQLRAAPEQTLEVRLRLAAVLIDSGDIDGAEQLLASVADRDWRPNWYRALAHVAAGRAQQAREAFWAVYCELPGELAPKLGLGLACELAGAAAEAAGWYEIVARTDPSITSACLGLARSRAATGERAAALAAYAVVPDSSSGYLDAQTARIRLLVEATDASPRLGDVRAAATLLEELPIDEHTREQLSASLLEAALELTLAGRAAGAGRAILGRRMTERDLRFGLEATYRALARRAGTRAERVRLVDAANRMRPRTWT